MNKQVKGFAVLMGAAIVSFAATGIATADEVAPGINCDDLTCTNNADTAYMVTGVADCLANLIPLPHLPGWADLPPTLQDFPFSQVVEPHTTATLTPVCVGLPLQDSRITGAEPAE